MVSCIVDSLEYASIVHNIFGSFDELVIERGNSKVIACY